jgi:hypothetical protein
MEALIEEIRKIRGVETVVAVSPEGRILAASPCPAALQGAEGESWARTCILALGGDEEADLLFTEGRIYVRRLGEARLFVKMRPETVVAMVRMAISVAG